MAPPQWVAPLLPGRPRLRTQEPGMVVKMLPHREGRNPGSRSGLRWKRSWVPHWIFLQLRKWPLLPRAPNTASPQQGELNQRFQTQLPPVDPTHSCRQGQKGRDQTPLGTLAGGSLTSYLSPTALNPSGGEKWRWLVSSILGCMSYRGSKINILPNTMPCGRWMSLGYHWHNRRPLSGGTPNLPYTGFAHRTFIPFLWPIELPGHLSKEYIGSSQCAAGLYSGIQRQARGPMWSCQGTSTMHGPIDDYQWEWCMKASLLGLVEEESRTPTSEEEAALLGREARTSGDPSPAPQQEKNARCTEPAEWATTPFSLIAPCHSPFLKRGKYWEGTDIDPNNTSQWDSWLPEWWQEFRPLPLVADEHHQDTQAQYLACQQVVAFHLLATKQVIHSAWLALPCIADLKRKEYLGPKDPRLNQDFWVVLKEETITLVIILQWCAIWAGAPLDMFCGAVQELHRYLVLVVGKSNWANMEEEIWAGVMNDPVVVASLRPPILRRTQPQTPIAERPMASVSPSAPELEKTTPPQDLALVPRRQPPTLPGFSPRSQRTSLCQL